MEHYARELVEEFHLPVDLTQKEDCEGYVRELMK